MGSLVLELQQDALNPSTSVLALLRKALVVAIKLNVQEFQKWIELELKGYSELTSIPSYRFLEGRIEGFNQYHGWQPVVFPDAKDFEVAKAISTMTLGNPISEVEKILHSGDESLSLRFRLDMELERKLLQALRLCPKLSLAIPKTSVHGIVEAVKNVILEWSLKLEQDGILGEEISFSQEEKQIAAKQDYSRCFVQINIGQTQMQSSSSESQANSGNFSNDLRGASVANFANQVMDNARQQANQYNYTTEQRQTLAEAAAEIQKLLEQLSQSYPMNTVSGRMQLATEAVTRIESNASLMQRVLSALQAGGVSALEQMLNHPAASFVIAALEDWQKPKDS